MNLSGQHHHRRQTNSRRGASSCGGAPSLLASSPPSLSLAILQSIPEDSEVFENDSMNDEDDPQLLLLTLANKERTARGVPALRESCYLNWVATQHATHMAKSRAGVCFHSVTDIGQLQQLLRASVVGENVQMGEAAQGCGSSLPLTNMHWETMHHPKDEHSMNRTNLLAPYFTDFGSGMAVAANGTLFTCQLFRTTKYAPCHSPTSASAPTTTTTQPECTTSPS